MEIERTARRARDAARDLMGGNSVFSQLGFTHIGPIDGHDMGHLLPVLKNLRDSNSHGPVLDSRKEGRESHPLQGLCERERERALFRQRLVHLERDSAEAGVHLLLDLEQRLASGTGEPSTLNTTSLLSLFVAE